jgi:hypothetical protein
MMGLCISLEIILSTELNNKVDRAVMLSVTSLMEDIASITSFVKLRPTPADPINAVGLIA